MEPNLYYLGIIRVQEMHERAKWAHQSTPRSEKRRWSFGVWFRSVRAQFARFRPARMDSRVYEGDDCIEAAPSA